MIRNMEIVERWFVGKKVLQEQGVFDEKVEITIHTMAISHGYPSIETIPQSLKESGDLLFKAFQFEYQGHPVVITVPNDTFNVLEPVIKIEYLSFSGEEEAKEFLEEIIDSLDDDQYWNDESEKRALNDLDYEIEEEDSFAEISINENRRFNEFLQMWHLREFDGLGYEVKHNGKIYTF